MDLIKFNWKWTRKIGFIGAFFAVFTAFNPVFAQEIVAEDTIKEKEVVDEEIFVIVEQMPEFPGGDEARTKFVQENLVYPRTNAMLSATVVVSFIVETDGSLSNFKVVRSVAPVFDDEALRVCKLMPNWISGKQRDKAVRVYSIMPITFALNEDTETEVKKSTKKDKKRKK